MDGQLKQTVRLIPLQHGCRSEGEFRVVLERSFVWVDWSCFPHTCDCPGTSGSFLLDCPSSHWLLSSLFPSQNSRHRLYIRQVPSQMQVIWMARTQIRRAAHQAALAHPQHTVRAVKAHYIQQYVTVQNCSCERGTMRNCAQQQPGLQQCLQLPVVFTPAAGHVCDTAAPEHVYRRREGSYDWVTCVIWLHVPGPLCYLPHVMTTAVT